MRVRTSALLLLLATVPAGAFAEGPKPTPTPRPPEPPLSAPPPSTAREPTRKGGSLADNVRRAKASATPVPKKKSLGTITNESLKKPDGSGKGSLQVGTHPVADLPSSGAATPADNDETRWRDRASAARQRVTQAEDEVRRLDLEAKRLENDFYAWSDGNYRDRVIKPAWDQARDDLKKARSEYDDALSAQNDLEEEARKAGVPAGWLREAAPR